MAEKPPVKPKAERRQGRRNSDSMGAKLARFKQEYLTNGHNGAAAAIAVGCSPRSARLRAHEYLKRLRASGDLAETAQRVAALAELSTANVLTEVQRVAFNDPRRFYRDDGTLKPPGEWDAHMAACVQSIETIERGEPGEADDELDAQPHGGALARKRNPKVAYIQKIKFWPKLDALDKLMKHQGLFERDNRQKVDNLAIQVNFVQAQEHGPADRAVQVQATLVKPNANGSHV